jgi:hypothetical protein
MKETFVQQCLDLLKREEVKKEGRILFQSFLNFVMYEIHPFVYFLILFVFVIFFLLLAILILLIFILRNTYSLMKH